MDEKAFPDCTLAVERVRTRCGRRQICNYFIAFKHRGKPVFRLA